MDYEDHLILIQNEYHLEETTATSWTPYQPFVVFQLSRKRSPSATNHQFRIFGRNSVPPDMIDIPVIPAEDPELVMQEIILLVNGNPVSLPRSFIGLIAGKLEQDATPASGGRKLPGDGILREGLPPPLANVAA